MEQQDAPFDGHQQEVDNLVEACLRGDHYAWSRFIDRYGRLIYTIPLRMGLPQDACDDVFQNVFAIVLKELPRLRDRRTLPRWLITITHHESSRWLRRSRTPHPEQPPPPEDPPEAELLRLERELILHESLDELGGRCRELLTALFLDPHRPSYQEISTRLGMPVSAIGPTRNRCFQKLLRIIGPRLD